MTDQSRREAFQELLENLLGCPHDETSRVYFQPGPKPGGSIKYPAIIYERDNTSMNAADNKPDYMFKQRYQVTYIDPNPDSVVLEKLRALPYCATGAHFATSGLNHDVFVIYH